MTKTKRWMIAGGLALLPLLAAIDVSLSQVAQPQPQPGVRPAPGGQAAGQTGAQGARATISDRDMIQWLIVDNEGEIALSKLAQQNAESDQVKEFAQQMIKDHTQFIQKLQSAGGAGGRPGGAGLENRREGQREEAQPRGAREEPQPRGNREEAALDDLDQLGGLSQVAQVEQERRRDAAQPGQPGIGRQPGAQPGAAQRGQGRGGPVDLVSLKRELGERCVQNATKMLREKEGQEFDKAFMGLQCFLHQQMLDTLQVFQQHTQNQQLQQLLAEGEQTTQEHLDHAKEILQGLEGRSGQPPRQARRPQQEKDRE